MTGMTSPQAAVDTRGGNAPIESLAVFTASAHGNDPATVTYVRDFGTALGERGITVVYGGACVGLMGTVADAALAAGGKVVGVIPEHLVGRELAHEGVTEMHVVRSMHERKAAMAARADGFVALPGGTGTLDEFFEAWTWGQLGLHNKPVGLLNVDGCWDRLHEALRDLSGRGFLSARQLASLVVADTTEELLDAFRDWTAPGDKWSNG